MGGYTQAWLISDVLKGFVLLCLLVWAFKQCFRETSSLPLFYQRCTVTATTVFLFLHVTTEHEPVHVNWQASLVLGMGVAVGYYVSVLYSNFVLARTYFSAARISRSYPPWISKMYIAGGTWIISLEVIIVIGILSTDDNTWSGVRSLSISLACFLLGTIIVVGLRALRLKILETLPKDYNYQDVGDVSIMDSAPASGAISFSEDATVANPTVLRPSIYRYKQNVKAKIQVSQAAGMDETKIQISSLKISRKEDENMIELTKKSPAKSEAGEETDVFKTNNDTPVNDIERTVRDDQKEAERKSQVSPATKNLLRSRRKRKHYKRLAHIAKDLRNITIGAGIILAFLAFFKLGCGISHFK
mmetsp:Transcript_10384/g.15499  ORF Transcript_10384/g.15499 Transcript_10384/m.15499 type:complete len:359 (+) Transcript_10384:901-1977(+)